MTLKLNVSVAWRIFLCILLAATSNVRIGQADDCQCIGGNVGVQEQKASTEVGYDQGFFIKQKRAEQDVAAFLLRINAWAHLRHTYFDSEGTNSNKNQFVFERARLVFRGNAWTPDFQYVMQLDGDNDQGTQVDLLDYYVTYDLGHDRLGWQKNSLRVRAGQWKVPFNRARQLSGRELSFAERSLASVLFDINRSVGVGLLGELAPWERPLQWQVALINGFKSSGKRPADGLDNRIAVSGRIAQETIGQWGEDGIADLTWHDTFAMRLGVGFAVSQIHPDDGTEESSLFGIDSGESYSTLLPSTVNELTVSLFSVDAGIRFKGLSLFTEYYFRTTDQFRGSSLPDLFDHGFVVQSGYFVVPKKLELLARWSRVTGNSATLGVNNQSADEIAFGLGYFINGRNNKIVMDATHINGAPIRESRLDYNAGDIGWTFRTQLQFGF